MTFGAISALGLSALIECYKSLGMLFCKGLTSEIMYFVSAIESFFGSREYNLVGTAG